MTTTSLELLLPAGFLAESLRADVLRGLTSEPRWLPPKWFYDTRGSALFERITTLPEYYLTRAERSVLEERAADIAMITQADTLVELGPGSAAKTRLLLDALRAQGTLERYVPMDVSDAVLVETCERLRDEYPPLDVHGVVGDFEAHLGHLPPGRPRRLTLFLGGTIGNFAPVERARFLQTLRRGMRDGDSFLLGTDLVKSPGVLLPAYDDPAGVTAEFNRNVLQVVNRELGADFRPERFEHVALWDPVNEWVEMRLRSTTAQRVRVPALDLDVDFAAGEELRTEISAKFRWESLRAELDAAGLDLVAWWTDPEERFAISLSVPSDSPSAAV